MTNIIWLLKHKYWWLPMNYQTINYTPQELRYKFVQYIKRANKNWEEIVISWFHVYVWLHRQYLTEHKKSQEYSVIVEGILTVFECRYEQKLAQWKNVAYLLNNRFRGNWANQSRIKVKISGVHPDVKYIFDSIIKRNSNSYSV